MQDPQAADPQAADPQATNPQATNPQAVDPQARPILELCGIDKHFGDVHANRAINLTLGRGSIHGIIGENGAGKSTLMSILYGYYQADHGLIKIAGKRVTIANPQGAIASGIGMVHQHFMLVDRFTVLENIMLGFEGGAWLSRAKRQILSRLETLTQDYGLDVDPNALIQDLSVGQRQRVEILKTLIRNARILILDEPTGVLTPQEARRLFDMLRHLQQQGVSILLITHKLREILAITDMVSVMRQGTIVKTLPTARADKAMLAELMVGRKLTTSLERKHHRRGACMVQVKELDVAATIGNLTSAASDPKARLKVRGVSFDLHAGEILAIAGVSGNGQSHLLKALAGILPPKGGAVIMGMTGSIGAEAQTTHSPHTPSSPGQMRRAGLAHIPDDRLAMGLVGAFPVDDNYMLGYHREPCWGKGHLFDRKAIRTLCQDAMRRWDIRPLNPDLVAHQLSGGNQQKLVIARELQRDPQVLIIGQPTRGVDIGAIAMIHRQILMMRDQGKAIMLVSSELDEIMALADRILVMNEGEITAELNRAEATEAKIGLLMAGKRAA